jgi:nicotinamide-nucleotide adenylyltransferase
VNPLKALVIGRFQPLHFGHEKLIMQAMKDSDSVVLAIGSSQESRTSKNPLNFSERKKLILSRFKGLEIIPSPDFESDDDWANDLIKKAKFGIIYSSNSKVKKIFSKKGFKIISVPRILGISGTRIRGLIRKNDCSYKKMISKECLKAMDDILAEKKIRQSI